MCPIWVWTCRLLLFISVFLNKDKILFVCWVYEKEEERKGGRRGEGEGGGEEEEQTMRRRERIRRNLSF